MKKLKKPLIIIATIILLISSGILYIRYRQYQEHQEMVRIASSKEAREVYEKYIKSDDPEGLTGKGFIHSYQIEKDSLDYNPMGGLMVSITYNNMRSVKVSFNLIRKKDGNYYSAYFVGSPEYLEFLKSNK